MIRALLRPQGYRVVPSGSAEAFATSWRARASSGPAMAVLLDAGAAIETAAKKLPYVAGY